MPDSEAMTPKEVVETTLPGRPVNWKERLADKAVRLRLLERLQTGSKFNRQAKIVERLVRKQQDGTLGKPEANAAAEQDEVITVGDQIQYHYHGSAKEQSAKKSSGLAKAAILAAGIATGGIGLGAAPIVIDMLTKPAASTDTDTDTTVDLEIIGP
jgi:hypothetical protein